jgi:hypothetical protein
MISSIGIRRETDESDTFVNFDNSRVQWWRASDIEVEYFWPRLIPDYEEVLKENGVGREVKWCLAIVTLKPFVIKSACFSPFRSRSALVATVVESLI